MYVTWTSISALLRDDERHRIYPLPISMFNLLRQSAIQLRAVKPSSLAATAAAATRLSSRPSCSIAHRSFTCTACQNQYRDDRSAMQRQPHVSIRSRVGLDQRPPAPPSETIFVGNLYFDATAQELQQAFEEFGEIANTKIVYDHTGVSRGFAYLQFTTVDAAQQAVEMMNHRVFLGRPLNVGFSRSQTSPTADQKKASDSRSATPTKTLFIGNLPFELNDAEVNRLFEGVEDITNVRVAVDRMTGRVRGFAHVDFANVDSAVAGRDIILSRSVMGRPTRVEYTFGKKEGNATRPETSALSSDEGAKW